MVVKDFRWALPVAVLLVASPVAWQLERLSAKQHRSDQIMLILRGVANAESPRGQLDEPSALEYARRIGFRGEVLDVAGETGDDSAQTRAALERIRRDDTITGLYGFSAGGYNTRFIWQQLRAAERERIRKVVVVGAPGIQNSDFAGASDIVIRPDPPEGHMAGPKSLVQSLH